ncbi:MAG: phage tail tape measure protein [Bacteroidia bacterium]|nr:phage tail tape measure protein [Bacteroidia bacterium]
MNVAMGMEFQGGAEQVATEMSKLRNIFTDIKSNDIGTDLQFISNAMLTLAQSGVATAPVVADFANRIGGIGIQVGLSTGQVLGLSATLQELNVSAERGGTAVVKILQKMLTESESFAEIAGMSIDSFRQLLNEDLFGAFVKVMEGSKKLGPNATGLAKIIKDLEVQGAGASEVFSKLGTNTEMLKDKVDLASESLANNNNLTAQANEMQNNFAGSVEKVSKSWNKLTSNPAIVSFFTSIADGASTAINWMDRMFKMVNITTGQFSLEGVAAVAAEEGMAGIAELEKEKNKQLAELKISLTGQSMAQLNLLKNMRKTALQQHMKDLQNIDGKNNPSAWNKQYGVVKDMLAEFKTIEDVIKSKSKTLSEKTQVFKKELTDKEKKEAAKKQKEAEKLAAENAKKEAEAFTKAMYEEIEHLQRSRQFLQDFEDGVFSEELQAKQDEAEAVASLVGDLFTEMDQDDEAMWQKRWDNLDKYQAYAQEFMGATSAIYNMFGQMEANELVRDRRVNDEKRKNLAKQLEDKVISQEQYNAKMAQIQQEEDAKAREIQRKQAERERMAAIFEATIKTTLAWLTAALDPTGVRYAAATAASIQLAALLATPMPEFYQGGYTGMGGNMDSKGGFPAILHPKEYVINSRLLENPVVSAMAGELERARTGQISPSEISVPNAAPQVVVQSDPELVQLFKDLKNNGIKGVWDWDYYERTLKRMDEVKSRKGL